MAIQRTCTSCLDLHDAKTMTMLVRGSYVCEPCRLTKYNKCDCCGTHYIKDERIEVELIDGKKTICKKCADSLKICAYSGSRVHPKNATHLEGRGRWVANIYLDQTEVSVISGKRDLIKTMYRMTDPKDDKKVYILRTERSNLDDLVFIFTTPDSRTSAGLPEQWTTGMFSLPEQYKYKFFYRSKGYEYLVENNFCIIVSPNGRIQNFVSNEIMSASILYDCGHTFDYHSQLADVQPETPTKLRFVLEQIQSSFERSAIELDVDGVVTSGKKITMKEMFSSLDLDSCFCPTCVMNDVLLFRRRMEEIPPTIGAYGETPTLLFHKTLEQDQISVGERFTEPFMGFELEVDDPKRVVNIDLEKIATEILNKVGRKHLYIDRDGSLQHGFEQITHPATMQYYLQERARYELLCSIPKHYELISHDAKTCGLHVHVGREFFTNKDGIVNAVFLAEKFFPEIFIFSRRQPDSAVKWAAKNLNAEEHYLIDRAVVESKCQNSRNRRMMINLSNTPTIEFRIFRGSLIPRTLFATLELVRNIAILANKNDSISINQVTWKDIITLDNFEDLIAYNDLRIGECWNGNKQISVNEYEEGSMIASPMEQHTIPGVLDKSEVKRSSVFYYVATNPVLLEAWPIIKN